MQSSLLKFALIAASAAVVAAAFALPASAEDGKVHMRKHRHHHYMHYTNDRPLTVTGRRHRVPVAVQPDPYSGPNSLVTGPNAVAATIVGVPFLVVGSLFPAQGDSPLVLIGGPAHLAGQVAEFPFYAIGTIFGAPPNAAY